LRYHEEGGIGAFYWSDEGFGCAISAKADRDLLLRIAELVYRQPLRMALKPSSHPHRESPADGRGIKRCFGSRTN
jgi:hypothetical protein